jgi:hypothetical protein
MNRSEAERFVRDLRTGAAARAQSKQGYGKTPDEYEEIHAMATEMWAAIVVEGADLSEEFAPDRIDADDRE